MQPTGHVLPPVGLIGPNAVLQLLPVLEQVGGEALRDQTLARAGIFDVPDGSEMIPEGIAARLHKQVRADFPDMAPELSWAAGVGTAEYIMAHRIPIFAQRILFALPAPIAARLLSRAIGQHAWTFAGSGEFEASSAWDFEISNNPVVLSESSDLPICHWHSAVFETLYRALVDRRARCTERTCCAAGSDKCRFTLTVEAHDV